MAKMIRIKRPFAKKSDGARLEEFSPVLKGFKDLEEIGFEMSKLAREVKIAMKDFCDIYYQVNLNLSARKSDYDKLAVVASKVIDKVNKLMPIFGDAECLAFKAVIGFMNRVISESKDEVMYSIGVGDIKRELSVSKLFEDLVQGVFRKGDMQKPRTNLKITFS